MPEPVTREAFVEALSTIDPQALRALLEISGYGAGAADTAAALARRVAACLWWSWSTPLGFVARKATLDAIVEDVAGRLRLAEALEGDGGAWERLDRLQARALAGASSAALDDLDPEIQRRLSGPSWWPSALGVGGAGSSYGAGQLGAWVVRLGAGPIGRLLPLIPQLAPYWRALRTTAAFAATVGTPLSVGLGALSINHALGSNYRNVVPLLLGAGALRAAKESSRGL